MQALCADLQLHTVCESAKCPNQGECFSQGIATFLILGDICTRNCQFCAIEKGRSLPIDTDEPARIAEAVKKLQLKHAVITSVTRDDLIDGGATHFVQVVENIKSSCPQTTIEVLIPDFQGSIRALQCVVSSHPDIIGHNVETVRRLYPKVRPKANYQRSLNLLLTVKSADQSILTKSGLMLGLGEQHDEIVAVMGDLRAVACDFLTIGQYLPPSHMHYPLSRYVPQPEFELYEQIGKKMGFCSVLSGAFVRSSFNAVEMYEQAKRTLRGRGVSEV